MSDDAVRREMAGMAPLAPLSALETERQVGYYVWFERRRFEVLGRGGSSVPEPEMKVLLATHARHHAWHASLWEELLPRRSGPDVSGLVAPGDAALAACLQADADLNRYAGTIERLVSAYRVVAPRALTAYGHHLEQASPVSDAALVRTCRLVLAEQVDDRRQGEAALQSLLTTGAAVDRASAHQSRLEQLLSTSRHPTEAG